MRGAWDRRKGRIAVGNGGKRGPAAVGLVKAAVPFLIMTLARGFG